MGFCYKSDYLFCRGSQQSFFLQGADCLCTNLEFYFSAVNNNSFLLQVRRPDLFGVALRKADIVAKLLAFAGNFTSLHEGFLRFQLCIVSVFTSRVNNPAGSCYTVGMLSGLSLTDIGVVILSILVSMALHEAMHGFVAHWLGDSTAQEAGRLTLNPLKHIDLYTTLLLPVVLILFHVPPFFAAKPVPFNPYRVKFGEYGAALVGLAGPLTNLVLAAAAVLVMRLGAAAGTELYDALSLFVQVNLGFFVFNMIPFPPLDGSRLLYAFAPEPLQRIMAQIEGAGFMVIILSMLLLFPFIGPIITSIIDKIYIFLLS